MKPLYVAVSLDRYRLPVAVGDSVKDLAAQTGRTISSICHSLNRAKMKSGESGTVVKVWITDQEWQEILEAEMGGQ